MDWMSFFCGIGATICVSFLILMFLPMRGMRKDAMKNFDNLERYWLRNNHYQKRQAEALEHIANSLDNKAKQSSTDVE